MHTLGVRFVGVGDVVVTPRQNELRVISFRKASRKEERLYEHYQATQP